MKTVRFFPRQFLLAAVFAVLALAPEFARAHAVLVTSSPAAHATVKGPEIAVNLKFNSRIDGAHSRLYLVDATGKVEMLPLAPQGSPDTLAVPNVKVTVGGYTIRWQATASDGHITRGEIPFTVQ